jgi:hypothetical protein
MFRKFILGLGACTLLVSFETSAFAAQKIGKVAAVVGSPSASGPGGNRGLSAGGDVFEDDKIVVSTGNAQIILDDGTRIVVGPDSSLVLDQYVKRGNKADKISLKALRGTYRFITGKSPKAAYRITTAAATIGIRGTGFDFWSRVKTGAVVLNGSVKLNGLRGGSVNVDSGCEMGEATLNSAQQLKGTSKILSIRKNLPFILDQSSLTRRFRLDVGTCRLGPPDLESSGEEPAQEFQGRD